MYSDSEKGTLSKISKNWLCKLLIVQRKKQLKYKDSMILKEVIL